MKHQTTPSRRCCSRLAPALKQTCTLFSVAALAALTALPNPAQASERRYSYIYGTTTLPKGAWEYEQWFTWSGYDTKDRFDFRHEIEYGVTDRFLLAFYIADWRYEHMDSGVNAVDYRSTSLEMIYNLTDPYNSPFGSALYGEISLGDEKFALESKLLLEKNFGPLNIAYNFKLEAEWEGAALGNLDENKGEFGNYLGASYQFNPGFLAGLELVHEWESEDWDIRSDDELFLGPNISWRNGGFYLTATALWDVLNTKGAPHSQVRLLAGFEF